MAMASRTSSGAGGGGVDDRAFDDRVLVWRLFALHDQRHDTGLLDQSALARTRPGVDSDVAVGGV